MALRPTEPLGLSCLHHDPFTETLGQAVGENREPAFLPNPTQSICLQMRNWHDARGGEGQRQQSRQLQASGITPFLQLMHGNLPGTETAMPFTRECKDSEGLRGRKVLAFGLSMTLEIDPAQCLAYEMPCHA